MSANRLTTPNATMKARADFLSNSVVMRGLPKSIPEDIIESGASSYGLCDSDSGAGSGANAPGGGRRVPGLALERSGARRPRGLARLAQRGGGPERLARQCHRQDPRSVDRKAPCHRVRA